MRFRTAQGTFTGVWTTAVIIETLQRELARAKRNQTSLGVIRVDLDPFPPVKQTFGLPVVDEVLRKVASKIEACVRSYDSVGRYGGREFLIVLPGCDVAKASAVAERLRRGISCGRIETPAQSVRITLSMGVAAPFAKGQGHGHNARELIQAAGAALHRAKQRGSNRIETG
jgi:two-component system, cell cycle response regulator